MRACGIGVFVLLGALAGTAGLFVSRAGIRVLGVPLPYGLVFALVTAALLFGQARRLLGVGGAVAAATGWAVPVVVGMWPRPEGDIVVGGDGLGIGFVLLGVVAAGWNIARAPHADDDRSSGG
jgi:hypothetical protein